MGDYTAFFYGTLMAPQVLHRVCYGNTPAPWQLKRLRVHPAILRNHCRHRVRGHDYPGLIPSKDDGEASVRGTYVTGLTEGDMWRLDIFEGDEYARKKVKVRLLDVKHGDEGEEEDEIETETYLWIAGDHLLEEGEWDFAHFQKEKMHRWVSDYPSFADVDNAVNGQSGHDGVSDGRMLDASTSEKGDEIDVSIEELRSAV